ncbi:MAG: hypothetical protein IT539_04050 [Bradyrhizobiaceae bacterium]|nr:hypothetical protein [Bradyrhizobiaceae bacterium]
MPMWGWAALVIAVIVVFALIFSVGDGTQQQAETPTGTPPATSTTPPPAKSPATPPPATQPPASQPAK